MKPRRGDVWWVRQPVHPRPGADPARERRPYLVVSADPWNLETEYPRVTICPLTGLEHVLCRYDTDVVLRRRETGLAKDSVVRCVEVYTVFRDLLLERAATVPGRRMQEVDRALRLYLALGEAA